MSAQEDPMIVHNVKISEQSAKRPLKRAHKKIYVGCAQSDVHYRDMLVHGKHRWELYSKPTIEFMTLDRGDTESVNHNSAIEEAIQKVDGVMVIVSAHTAHDQLARWEIECAFTNSIPIVGVDVRRNSEGIPPENLSEHLIKFGWEWFAEFFNRL